MASFRKNLQISLGGIISTQVDLHSVLPSNRGTGLKRLCPEHHEPVKQSYACPKGHPITDWVEGQEVNGGWKIVPRGERPEFDAVEVLELNVLPAAELEANTFEGNGIYYCQPSSPTAATTWLLFNEIVQKEKVALVAKAALRRGRQHMWRLQSFRDYLVLREIVFPADIRLSPERPEAKIDRNIRTLVNQFLDQLQTTWQKFDATDESKKLLEAWIEMGQLVTVGEPSPEVPTVNQAEDLMATLRKAVENNKKK